jgi:hypothetical protein
LTTIPDPSFFDCPFFPFDLCLTGPVSAVAQKLQKKGNALVAFMPFLKHLALILPGQATAIGLSVSDYIETVADEAVGRIVRVLDGGQEKLRFKFAMGAVAESNVARLTDANREAVLRAWNLLMLAVERNEYSVEQKGLLLSYFVAAAVPDRGVDVQIQEKARICIIRICGGPKDAPQVGSGAFLITRAIAPKRLFGVSVAEVLEKEATGGRALSDPEVVVPEILRDFVRGLIRLGAFNCEGIFRLSGSRADEDRFVASVDAGQWNFDCQNLHLLASITKRWLRDLSDSLVPLWLIDAMPDQASAGWCIAKTLDLPVQHRDTIIYFIGFLQHLARFSSATKMDVRNLVICIAPNFTKLPPITDLSPAGMRQSNQLQRLITCLVEELDTSGVYNPDA